MTQDNAIWPYICNNYNLQAPYYGMLAANQTWMFWPLFDRVIESIPYFKSRAQNLVTNVVQQSQGENNPPPKAYGHYKGIEMPGHIGAYLWMYDGEAVSQDAGQRFNAPFTGIILS